MFRPTQSAGIIVSLPDYIIKLCQPRGINTFKDKKSWYTLEEKRIFTILLHSGFDQPSTFATAMRGHPAAFYWNGFTKLDANQRLRRDAYKRQTRKAICDLLKQAKTPEKRDFYIRHILENGAAPKPELVALPKWLFTV